MMLRTKQVKMTKFRYIAIAFNTSEPNYMDNLNVTIHRHNTKYAMMKFWQMPLLLLPMSQNMGKIVEIFVF